MVNKEEITKMREELIKFIKNRRLTSLSNEDMVDALLVGCIFPWNRKALDEARKLPDGVITRSVEDDEKLSLEIQKNTIKNVLDAIRKIDTEEFAEWLHNQYEEEAKARGWRTQKKCQVKFDDLPEENKGVMLSIACSINNFFVDKIKGDKNVKNS